MRWNAKLVNGIHTFVFRSHSAEQSSIWKSSFKKSVLVQSSSLYYTYTQYF